MKAHCVAVVGAGPAGIAAAVEVARLGARPMLFDATGCAGGTIRMAHEVRDVPFVEDRVTGERVAEALGQFLVRWNVPIVPLRVTRLRTDDTVVLLDTASRDAEGEGTYRAEAVVIAVGTEALVLDVPGLELGCNRLCSRASDLFGDGCSDGFPDGIPERVVVIGGSDVAMDQARWLRARGVAVDVLARGTLRAPSWLVNAAEREGVVVRTQAKVVRGVERPGGLELRIRVGDEETNEKVNAIVAAVGRIPVRIDGARDAIAMHPERIRIAGDGTGRRARHVVAALGDGCVAASELLARLAGRKR